MFGDRTAGSGSVLDVRGLNVHFRGIDGEVQAVSDLSFRVGRGEMVGLVGESGSGKSVTALAIMGLLPPVTSRVTGEAQLRGRDLLAMAPAERAGVRGRDISMIFQEPMRALDPVFRVGDQIAETLRAHDRVSRRAAAQRAVELLAAVGIPDPRHRARAYPHQLSGGMRQRVMIAIALIAEPSVLIADEPTTALDVTIQAQILELLEQLSAERGMAVLLITHDLGVVAESCSRVLTLYAGQLVEDCPVDDALTTPAHPYTAGLIASIPRTEDRKGELNTIPGRVPPLSAMPDGCRFRPRCEHSAEACLSPQRVEEVGNRLVRCCRHADLRLTGAVVGGAR